MYEPHGEQEDRSPTEPEVAPPTEPQPGASEAGPAADSPVNDLASPPERVRGDLVSRGIDPWAHRRGEPRTFAFFWTMYLFFATAAIFYTAMAGQAVAPDVMRPAATLLLVLMMTGICVLWPMVRLSQAPDPEPLSGAIKDLMVMLIPAQALIWPQTLWWLARWPLGTVVALTTAVAAWGLLTAGILALAQAGRRVAVPPPRPQDPPNSPRPLKNIGWMVLFIALAAGGVGISFGTGGALGLQSGSGTLPPPQVDTALMLSPLGTVLELTRDTAWTGRATPMRRMHWLMIAVVAGAAAGVWGLAGARSRRERIGLRFPLET